MQLQGVLGPSGVRVGTGACQAARPAAEVHGAAAGASSESL